MGGGQGSEGIKEGVAGPNQTRPASDWWMQCVELGSWSIMVGRQEAREPTRSGHSGGILS